MAATIQTDSVLNRSYAEISPITISGIDATRVYLVITDSPSINKASVSVEFAYMDDIFSSILDTAPADITGTAYSDYVAAGKTEQFAYDYAATLNPGGYTIVFVP